MEEYRLWCLMRTDLASLNAGKAIAQGMHAQMVAQETLSGSAHWSEMWKSWKAQANGFGTTITLGGKRRGIDEALKRILDANLPGSWILDPTYPLLDGEFLHLIPLETCAWVFGLPSRVTPLLKPLELHP